MSHTGNLTGGIDYEPGPFTVTFPAETTTALINVTIIDNNIKENDKSFYLTFNSSSITTNPSPLSNDVNVGNVSEVLVTIIDDERKFIVMSLYLIPNLCAYVYLA